MRASKLQQLEYIKKIYLISKNTIFQWSVNIEGRPPMSKKRTYWQTVNDESKYIRNSFITKACFFRSTIYNEETDELRLDLDYETIEENLDKAKLIVKAFEQFSIKKYEVYLSSGKGVHICARFNIIPFLECGGRNEIRRGIWEALELDIKVDHMLFSTVQALGLEGYNHRKTNKPKRRIKMVCDKFKVQDNNLNFRYLEDEYVNNFEVSFIEKVKRLLDKKKFSQTKSKEVLNLNEKEINFDRIKFDWHINRFRELYINNLVCGSINRFSDMVTRYVYLTTRNKKLTIEILKVFFSNIKIIINVEDRLSDTLAHMKANAIFIYKDILTAREFYKGCPWETSYEPLKKIKK